MRWRLYNLLRDETVCRQDRGGDFSEIFLLDWNLHHVYHQIEGISTDVVVKGTIVIRTNKTFEARFSTISLRSRLLLKETSSESMNGKMISCESEGKIFYTNRRISRAVNALMISFPLSLIFLTSLSLFAFSLHE